MAKKNKKEKKPRTPARFAAGAQVRVKPGTTDPDFPDIPLGGWAGRISDVDQRSVPPTYLIEWNKHTLDHMHPVYRKRCERDGLELESMWLGEDDIEPGTGEPAVIEQPTSIVTRPLNLRPVEGCLAAWATAKEANGGAPASSLFRPRCATHKGVRRGFSCAGQAEAFGGPPPRRSAPALNP